MSGATVTEATVFEDGGAALMARVVGNDAANIIQATIDQIGLKVFQDGTEQTPAPAVQVGLSVFDTLQTDDRWTKGGGYNFRFDVPSAVIDVGDTLFRFEFCFVPKTELTGNAAGTATGGGTNYVLLEDNGTQDDDVYNGVAIVLTGGTGGSPVQDNFVTDYEHTLNANGERYCEVAADWTTVPDATTTYIIGAPLFKVVFNLHAKVILGS